jgi:diguanylate cyclase (GGDEF)-like protein
VGRFRLICALVATVVAATVACSSWWMIHDARRAMGEQVRVAEALAAGERAGTLGESLTRSHDFLGVVAKGPAVLAAFRTGDYALLRSIRTSISSNPGISGAAFYGPADELLVSIASQPTGRPDDPPQFRTATNEPEAFASLGHPVRDSDGTVIGGIRVEFSLRGVSPQLRQSFARFDGATSVIDRDGRVLLASGDTTSAAAEARALRAAVMNRSTISAQVAGRIASVAPVPGYDLAVIVSATTAAADAPANRLALRLGIAYLVTGLLLAGLAVLLIAAFRHARRALQASNELLVVQAATDPLTGLANRRALEAAIADLSTHEETTGVVVVDLDGLKTINDTCGHAVGDEALRRTAAAIRSVVRPADLVARLGGDEFVIVLPNSDPWRTADVADRARAAIASIELPAYGHLSATTGIDASGGSDLPNALERADRHLYQGKQLRRV